MVGAAAWIFLLVATSDWAGGQPEPGPSLVRVQGRQLLVQKRNADGSLQPERPYIIRGVLWSPASTTTNTSKFDPDNANVRRPEFGIWQDTDIPLLAAMNVNTVRMVIDPGFDATLGPIGLAVLDQLYENGIMAIVNVDDAINDLSRVSQAVSFYKNHPAVLFWMTGSEWNINLYFGVASSVADAANRTQQAAQLIKSLDSNHPVATSYGDIDIDSAGLRLSDTAHYVNNVCTSVDIWAVNIYRGKNFGLLFQQWASISQRPLLIGEFGTDAFNSTILPGTSPSCPGGAVDQAQQAQWNLSLWDDLFRNLSAHDPNRIALGGTVFEWNDEWWKVSPPSSQSACGFLFGGHPDNFANEEYFGVVDISRQPREIYNVLKTAFDPGYVPEPRNILYRAVSAGFDAPGVSFGEFWKDDVLLYRKTGEAGGGRGFNVAVFDPVGARPGPIRNFDTWGTRSTGTDMTEMTQYLQGLPNGVLVMIAVGDEAGLNLFDSCTRIPQPWIESALQTLEALGATMIRNYCYRDSWAFGAIKGEGVARAEMLSQTEVVSADVTLEAPSLCNPESLGDWIVSKNCLLDFNTGVDGNVTVKENVVLTIADGFFLDLNLVARKLRIENGAKVVIKPGARIH